MLGRTQKGNNNAYCQDNELTGLTGPCWMIILNCFGLPAEWSSSGADTTSFEVPLISGIKIIEEVANLTSVFMTQAAADFGRQPLPGFCVVWKTL